MTDTHAPSDGTANVLNGVAGNLLQGRDFHGDIHLHVPPLHPMPPPRQLPADISCFTGRDGDLWQLNGMLDDDTTMALSTITGTAGVGKTALAVRWAHSVRDLFPDGDLYVNLRGYDEEPAMTPSEALDGFLYALGAPPATVPGLTNGKAAYYRTLLQGRRILILLDNANSAEQIRPLLPGTLGCKVLVTSRSRLSGLGIRNGAKRITLEPLTTDDAVTLLRHVVGPRRVPERSVEACVVAERCAGLPLALRIAADRLVDEPTMNVQDLASELSNEAQRLELLDVSDDGETSIRAVFSWSFRSLPPGTAVVYRRLGLHPGPEFATDAALACGDRSDLETMSALRSLSNVHLLKRISPDRYRMHDLVYLYARECASKEEPASNAATLQRHVLHWYLGRAVAACNMIDPRRLLGVKFAERLRENAYVFDSTGDASGWFQTEHANLLAAVHRASAVGEHAIAWQLTVVMATPLYARRASSEWRTISLVGWASAQHLDDDYAQARVLIGLSGACRLLHRFDEALTSCDLAEALFCRLQDRAGEAMAIHNSGTIHAEMGQYAEAATRFKQALARKDELGPGNQQDHTLDHLGVVYRSLGQLDTAAEVLREALQICTTNIRCELLNNLGETYRLAGRHTDALKAYDEALDVALETNDLWGQGASMRARGAVLRESGEAEMADALLRQALAIFERIGSADATELRAALSGKE